MNWDKIDGVIIVAFIGYALFSGLRSKSKASENLEEYLLAGRSLPGWKAGLSMTATQFAADTPLVVCGLIATMGVFSIWRFSVYGLAFLLLGFVLAPAWRRSKVLTDAELTEFRYGTKAAAWLRGIKALYLGTIFNCFVLGMVLLAAARIAEPFLVWNAWLPNFIFTPFEFVASLFPDTIALPHLDPNHVALAKANNLISILAIVTVTTFYSTAGGLRAVVNTDVVQVVLMFLGTFIFAWSVVETVGGLSQLPIRVEEVFRQHSQNGLTPRELLAFTPSAAKDAGLAILGVYALQWIAQINSDGTGYLAQRTMACRSDRDATQAAVIFTFSQIVLRTLMWIVLAIGLILIFPADPTLTGSAYTASRESIYVRGIATLDLPWGVRGLMLTAMLAALASTVDTHLNWGASYWTNDLYDRFICRGWLKRTPRPAELVRVARCSNLLILALGLLVMTQLQSVAVAWEKSLLFGAGVGIIGVLRWIWWRISARGEITAYLSSAILTAMVAFDWIALENAALTFLMVACVPTILGVAVSLFTKPDPHHRVAEFYRRAKPPGFWRPFSGKDENIQNEERTRLYRGLAATFICGFSFFCLLTGIGSMLVGSPAPTWFPYARLWQVLLIVTGVGLTPVWWRLGFPSALRRS